jgi:hypothetical protein
MTTKLHKDGDALGVETRAESSNEFLQDISVLLAAMIDHGMFCAFDDGENAGMCDWQFQLDRWLPLIVEVAVQVGLNSHMKEFCGHHYAGCLGGSYGEHYGVKDGFLTINDKPVFEIEEGTLCTE